MNFKNLSFVNYHSHNDDGSNIQQPDAFVSVSDYCKRTIELGLKTVSTCNHGCAGDILNAYEQINTHGYIYYDKNDKSDYIIGNVVEFGKLRDKKKKLPNGTEVPLYPNISFELYELNFLFANEIYFQDNPDVNKGYHLVLVAKNKEGMWAINKLNAYAVKYLPNGRWNLELLKKLPAEHIYCTTACLASPIRDENNGEYIFKELRDHFKDHLFLEVQPADTESQVIFNRFLIEMSRKYNIRLISGLDSHYIYTFQRPFRERILQTKGIKYPFEDGMMLDYPDVETIVNRYRKQGVLTDTEIFEAINNTNIFEKTEGVYFDKEVKLPKIYRTDEDMYKDCARICEKNFPRLIERNPHRAAEYYKEVMYEINTFKNGKMLEYPLLLHFIMELGEYHKTRILDKEYVLNTDEYGVVSRTGRGSGGGSLFHNLLGLTTLDRLDSEVPMLFERFISEDRLKSKIMPDVDMNLSNQTPFVMAAKTILGDENAYFMMAKDTLQTRNACRTVARGYSWLTQKQINEITDLYDEYITHDTNKELFEELFETKECPDKLAILANLEKTTLGEIYLMTKQLIGCGIGVTQHPCGLLLSDQDIEKTLGLVRMKNGQVCVCTTGLAVDIFKYLKLDLLLVDTWKIIADAFKDAEIPLIDIRVLSDWFYSPILLPHIKQLIKDGKLATVCQFNTKNGMQKIMKFLPDTIGKMSALSAGMRPGFATLIDTLINLQYFAYGIAVLDDYLSRTSGCNQPFMLYQEQTMKVIQMAGISASDSYIVLKAISKKQIDKILKYKELFLNGFTKYLVEMSSETRSISEFENISHRVWQIIEDSSAYSFNSAHSLSYAYDAAYALVCKACAFLSENDKRRKLSISYMKAALDSNKDDQEQTQVLLDELKYLGITVKNPDIMNCYSNYFVDFNTYTIYRALGGIEGIGPKTSESIFELTKQKFNTFMDVLVYIKENPDIKISQTVITKLIKIDFFYPFANVPTCIAILNMFYNDKEYKYKLSSSKNEELRIAKYKQMYSKLLEVEEILKSQNIPDIEPIHKIKNQIEILGITYDKIPELVDNYIVMNVEGEKQKLLTMYNVSTGNIEVFKYDYKLSLNRPIDPLQLIIPKRIIKRNKKYKAGVKDDGTIIWGVREDEYWNFLENYDRFLLD